jgi:hypothetical protein
MTAVRAETILLYTKVQMLQNMRGCNRPPGQTGALLAPAAQHSSAVAAPQAAAAADAAELSLQAVACQRLALQLLPPQLCLSAAAAAGYS